MWCLYMVQKAAEATGSYSEGHGPLVSGRTLCYHSVMHRSTFLQGNFIILEWQVPLIQNEVNTMFTLWRHPNSYYACMVILNATGPKNLSRSFWVFRLGDSSILHSTITSFTSPSLPKLSWMATSGCR